MIFKETATESQDQLSQTIAMWELRRKSQKRTEMEMYEYTCTDWDISIGEVRGVRPSRGRVSEFFPCSRSSRLQHAATLETCRRESFDPKTCTHQPDVNLPRHNAVNPLPTKMIHSATSHSSYGDEHVIK